jgi:hypothetical protein
MPQREARVIGRTAAAFELRQLNVHSSRAAFKVNMGYVSWQTDAARDGIEDRSSAAMIKSVIVLYRCAATNSARSLSPLA